MSYKKIVPNLLTLFRFILVPVYLLALYSFDISTGAFIALIVFVTAGITDFLDGFFARKFKSITDFGKVADPLADKFIVSVALISLTLKPISLISYLVVLIIILREVLVTYLRSYNKRKNYYMAANIWGKVKTALQMVGIITALFFISAKPVFEFMATNERTITLLLQIYFWIVAVVTVVSGVSYLPLKRMGKVRK